VRILEVAHRWLALLEEGRFGFMSELAAAERMDPSQVRRYLGLTPLKHGVVPETLDGREPGELSLKGLLGEVEVVCGGVDVWGILKLSGQGP